MNHDPIRPGFNYFIAKQYVDEYKAQALEKFGVV